MSTRTRVQKWAPAMVAIGASLFLLSACGGAPSCGSSGTLAGVGAEGGGVKGALPGNPEGSASDGGYGGASVGMAGDPKAVDGLSSCM